MPPLGVILFGSTNKICENPDFVAQAQHFLRQLCNKDYIDWNFIHPLVTFNSVFSCLGSSSIKNNIWHHSVWQQRQDDQSSSEYSSLASELLSTISQTNSRTLACGLKPRASYLPVATAPSGIFNGHHHISYKFRNQRGILTEDHYQLLLNNGGLHSNYKSVNHLFTSYCNSDMTKEDDQYAYTVHKPFDILCKNSTLLHSRVESQAMLDDSSAPSNKSVPNLDSFQHYSSPLVPSCSLATTIKSSSKSSPYSTMAPSTHELENMTLAPSTSESETHHSHGKPIKNHIYSNKGLVNLAYSTTAESSNSPKLFIPSILEQDGNWNASTVHAPSQLVLDNDLFDGMELDLSSLILRQGIWDDLLPVSSNNLTNLSSSLSNCISELEMDSVSGAGKDFFFDSSLEELLDAVVSGNAYASSFCNSDSLKANVIASQDSRHPSPAEYNNIKENTVPAWNNDKMMRGPSKDTRVDDSCSVINNREDLALNQPKRMEKSAKVVRRKARPGESSRPRPKDRQQIQDRVKELREIVPNGAKCSIDGLLDRTIRHMLFLQSVTEYASKLKQVDQPKIISEESGVVLRDNANGGFSGATWAYEVAGQTMVCPILVEDLHPSGQMLVEMLCEERDLFLEIADVVRGFGLTILKGIMENRGRKVWARFIVEANRDVKRMDIFLSLVQLLQQTCNSILSCEPQARAGDASLSAYQQSSAAIPIGLVNGI